MAVFAGAIVLAGAEPAIAHSCAQAIRMAQGQTEQVQVGATIGNVPVDEVTFQFSDVVDVQGVGNLRGWQGTQVDQHSVRFTGGPLDPNACATFPVTIRAAKAATSAVLAMEHQTDGTVVQHPADGDIFSLPDGSGVAVNHAGPPNSLFEQVIVAEDHESGLPPLVLVASIVGLGVLVVVGYAMFTRPPKRNTPKGQRQSA